ncbi:MAG: pyridoxamine 5'-phosphate oxidase family protein [Planctomycetes bacterium]|nr:pyridoxamine 5'-phosphate oxidase family protein [Planctomycetota bacterium]
MAALPDVVLEAWKDRKGPIVLATVNKEGIPNIIYASCTSIFGTDKVVVADNYFSKTRANILAGCKGSLLFITEAGKAYQIKGSLEYHKEGEVFDDMKKWNPVKLPGHAAVAVNVEEVYSGADRLL